MYDFLSVNSSLQTSASIYCCVEGEQSNWKLIDKLIN